MAGLGPGHPRLAGDKEGVDARLKAGHDDALRLCLRRQRGLGLFDDRLERRRLVDREIGQHLAVDLEAGLGEPVDERL